MGTEYVPPEWQLRRDEIPTPDTLYFDAMREGVRWSQPALRPYGQVIRHLKEFKRFSWEEISLWLSIRGVRCCPKMCRRVYLET